MNPVTLSLVIVGALGLVGMLIGIVRERPQMWKLCLVIAVLACCAASLYPPKDRLSPALDLAGGTSLLYALDTSKSVDPQADVKNTIATIRKRLDPDGVRNLIFREESGNRIEIQIPRPAPEVDARRKAFDAAFENIQTLNVKRHEVTTAIARSGAERTAAMDALIRGVPQRKQILLELAEAHEEVQAAEKAYEPFRDAEYSDQQLAAMERLNEARISYDKQSDQLKATNIEEYELGNVLDRSGQRKVDELGQEIAGSSLRDQAVADLTAARPHRADQIRQVVALYEVYQEVKGPLDDPNDVIRMLKGAGVLEFRIAVRTAEEARRGDAATDAVLPETIEQLRKDLRERGPLGVTSGASMGWYVVDDESQWLDDAFETARGQRPAVGLTITRSASSLAFIAAGVLLIGGFMALAKRRRYTGLMTVVLGVALVGVGAIAMVQLPAEQVEEVAEGMRASEQDLYSQLGVEMRRNPAGFFKDYFGLIAETDGSNIYLLLWDKPGNSITAQQGNWELGDVYTANDQVGLPAVGFHLNAAGGNLMGKMTEAHLGRSMAIVLDDRVYSAPSIRDRISNRGIITGRFTQTELLYLINTLKAGSLKARLSEEPISQRTVGPQLGADNLKRGLEAAMDALIAVIIFMIIYYFFAGTVADVALLANIVIILGVMALFRATFTLPGIAGIVLTIGMCVDANVLVFERVREELERGVDMATALRLGYQRAFSAIIDGNLTNLIVCFILYYTASAEVKGFAVTLGVGIGATLFTSLFMTRIIFTLWTSMFGMRRIAMLPTVFTPLRMLLSPHVNWIGKRVIFFGLSTVAVAGSIALCVQRGQELLDIEFRGGTEVAFRLTKGEALSLQEVRSSVQAVGQWSQGDFDPATLSGDDKALHAEIQKLVEKRRGTIRQDAGDRVERDKKEIAVLTADLDKATDAERKTELSRLIDQARASLVEAEVKLKAVEQQVQQSTDLSPLETATVVNIGEAVADGGTYTAFSVVSTVEDAPTVAGVVRTLFKNVIDVQTPLQFAQQEDEAPDPAIVLPVPVEAARLGDLIGQDLVVNYDISAYEGGVAIVLKDIQPAAPIGQIEERLKVMSRQPEYEAVRFRTREVFQLTASEPGSGLYTAVAVLAVDPAVPYQVGGDQQWQAKLADVEWNLVRDALSRETSLSKVSNFTSTVARTIGQQAIMAMLLSFAAIIAYVWFRFGSLRYGLAAILALAHDVIIAMGLVALCGLVYDTAFGQALLLEPFKLNMALIAALLTIVGYSLNDTIVVFDRIRENRGKLAHATAGIVNDSINQTISRTLLTSGTTLLAVMWMYVLGGKGIHGFAFALVVGVLVGTYSSIAIASQVLLIGAGGRPGGGAAASDANRTQPSRKRLG